jgi:signal peptidase I
MKKLLSFCWEISKIFLITLAIVAPIRYFLFQPFFVKGESMMPNFSEGDYLIVDEISSYFRDPLRGEVIVFKFPNNPSQRFIKRVIGLPGETVEINNNQVAISKNGEVKVLDETAYLVASIETKGSIKITLADNEYFVMGDNRNFSFDSRSFGPVPKDKIIGRALIRAWPIDSLSKISAPAY